MGLELAEVRRVARAGELLEHAALSGDGLPTSFLEVAKLLGGPMFQLFNFTNPAAPDLLVPPEYSGLVVEYLDKGWHALDTYSLTAGRFTKHGLLLSDQTLLPDAIRARDPFYQDFVAKWGMGGFTSWTFDLAGERWAFTHMSYAGKQLGSRGVEMMRQLIPSANRAALLAAIGKDTRVGGIAEGLEHGRRPAFVIDHNGRLMLATPSAQKLLDHDLYLRSGQIRAADRTGDTFLRQIAVAAGMSAPPRLRNFSIARQGRRPLVVMPVAVRDMGLDRLPGARMILVVTDIDAQADLRAEALQQAFDLSPRETQLVLALSDGTEIAKAAQALRISAATARHMLKSIFSKTGVNRQAELIALIGRMLTGAAAG